MLDMMQDRSLESIKLDMKIISSSKLNSSQSKLLLIGIIYEIIQRKDLFPKNIDLKNFVQVVFVEPTGSNQFRDYLFLSRTLLGSRVCNIIMQKFEYSNVLKTVEKLNEILPGNKENYNNHIKNNDDSMNDWINFLRGGH
jgi:hypothetical protein